MSRNWFKTAVVLMWLALPSAAWNYWSAWGHLPGRMAVHFDRNWRPNGYESKVGAIELGLGILLVLLVLFTVSSLMVYAAKPGAAWLALAIAYVAVAFCWYGNYSIVRFNLNAPPQFSVRSQLPTLGEGPNSIGERLAEN